jgi:uncharacterized protein (DUF362 family)
MVDMGIATMTGIGTVGEAWKSIFPGISKNSKVTIKINCISGSPAHLMVHKEVVDSITSGLQLMEVEGSGFPAENILIWDMHEHHLINAGFEINSTGEGVQCKACDTQGVGYDNDYPIDVSGSTQYPCTILTKECDYLINLGLIKDHNIAAGTFTLKNHYGSISYPWRIHSSQCDPYIAVLNADPLFEEKTVLLMLDSLFGVYSGGPIEYPQVVYNTIHFTNDRLAVDACGKDILNQTRKDHGMGELDIPHLETAESLGIGTLDYSVERVTPTGIEHPSNENSKVPVGERGSPILHQNYPNPFNPHTFVRFYIPGNNGERKHVRLSIYDTGGRLVKKLAQKRFPPGSHMIRWDGTNDSGRKSGSGIYTAVLEVMGKRSQIQMLLVK